MHFFPTFTHSALCQMLSVVCQLRMLSYVSFPYADSFPPGLPAPYLPPPSPLYAAPKNNLLKYKANDIIRLLKALEWLPIILWQWGDSPHPLLLPTKSHVGYNLCLFSTSWSTLFYRQANPGTKRLRNSPPGLHG